MNQNSKQLPNYADEVDIRSVVKLLLESKKLIFFSILFFTTAAFIYSTTLKPSFRSSTLIEIGSYDLAIGKKKLIESSSNLIKDLKLNLVYKNPKNEFSQQVLFESVDSNLIRLKTSSVSVEKNEKLLRKYISYINQQHNENLNKALESQIQILANEIGLLKSEKRKILKDNELEINRIEQELTKLKLDLPIIELEINQLNNLIIEENKNLNAVKSSSLSVQRAAISPTLEQIIFSYNSKINKLNLKKNNLNKEINKLTKELSLIISNPTFLGKDGLITSSSILNNKIETLENQKFLIAQSATQTLPILDINTETVKGKNKLIIFTGFILGISFGFLLVFLNKFIQSYKEFER